MDSESSLQLAAAFLGVAPTDAEAVRARMAEFIAECEELQNSPRANRIQRNKARSALTEIAPWLPGVEIAARLAKLEGQPAAANDLAHLARIRLETRKLAEAVAALPVGDERELFSLRLAPFLEKPEEVRRPAPPAPRQTVTPFPSQSPATQETSAPPVARATLWAAPTPAAMAPNSPSAPGPISPPPLEAASPKRPSPTIEIASKVPPAVTHPPLAPPASVLVPGSKTTPSLPFAPPSPAALDRFTLLQPNGRKLHVWGTAQLRLGRTNESDFPVFACVRGNPAATKALTGEISRQHAELWLEPSSGEAFVRDGWRPGAAGSSFGTMLGGRKLSAVPVRLQNDQILRLGNRDAEVGMPGWKVRIAEPGALEKAPGVLRADAPAPGVCGVWLSRLDEAPDDLLLLRGACNLGAMGGTGSGPWLWRRGAGFLLLGASGEVLSLENVEAAWPGARLLSSGKVEPTGLRELLVLK